MVDGWEWVYYDTREYLEKKEGPPESWKDKGRLECRWLGIILL